MAAPLKLTNIAPSDDLTVSWENIQRMRKIIFCYTFILMSLVQGCSYSWFVKRYGCYQTTAQSHYKQGHRTSSSCRSNGLTSFKSKLNPWECRAGKFNAQTLIIQQASKSETDVNLQFFRRPATVKLLTSFSSTRFRQPSWLSIKDFRIASTLGMRSSSMLLCTRLRHCTLFSRIWAILSHS